MRIFLKDAKGTEVELTARPLHPNEVNPPGIIGLKAVGESLGILFFTNRPDFMVHVGETLSFKVVHE